MISSDYHTHCKFSTDSFSSPESMVLQAIKKEMSALCFTDHMDIDFPSKKKGMFVFEPEDYFTELNRLKEKYIEKCRIVIGIELGLMSASQTVEKMKQLTADYPFEFILGSVHIVDNHDPYQKSYWKTHDAYTGLLRYFESILESISVFDGFHVLGHIDYAVRVIPKKYGEKNYLYADYQNLLETIVKKLIADGKGMEVNTNPLRNGLPFLHPKKDILCFYRRFGGEIVTIGSDAHRPQDIAADFETAREFLLACGFRYYTEFYDGKPVMKPLL